MSLHPVKKFIKPNGKMKKKGEDPNAINSMIVKTVAPLLIPQPLISPIIRKDTFFDKLRQVIKRQNAED